MKKIRTFCVASILMACILLCGCSSNPSYKVQCAKSSSVVKVAENAIEIIDRYLDYKISVEEMQDQLIPLYQRLGGDYKDYDISEQEQEHTIAYNLCMISDFANRYSDEEILLRRDTIAANAGISVSGTVFQNTDIFDEDDMLEKFDLRLEGISDLRIFKKDDGRYMVSAAFDFSHGFTSTNVQEYFEKMSQHSDDCSSVTAEIQYYGQRIAWISMPTDGNHQQVQTLRVDQPIDVSNSNKTDNTYEISDIPEFLDFSISK